MTALFEGPSSALGSWLGGLVILEEFEGQIPGRDGEVHPEKQWAQLQARLTPIRAFRFFLQLNNGNRLLEGSQ